MEVCYRHPNRETGVSCSNCGNPICPDCMTTTPVGMRCPDCARQKTKVKTVGAAEPTLTYVLMGINIALWLGFGLAGSGADQLYADAALSRIGLADGHFWQVVTAGFLHAKLGEPFGFLHIFSNMFSLYILGTLLEPAVGRLRFALIYGVSLLAGSFGAILLSSPTTPTVGASGAIFGLMGAALVVMRNRGINPLESGLGLWIGLNLLITFTIPGISIGGHIGGLIGGALAAFVLFDLRERVSVPAIAPNLIAAGIGVLAVVGSFALSASG